MRATVESDEGRRSREAAAESSTSPALLEAAPRPRTSTMFRTVILSLIALSYCDCANILGVFPTMSRSHFFVFEPLLKELARRGHTVAVITNFPQQVKLANYTDIDVSAQRIVYKDNVPIEIVTSPIDEYAITFKHINDTESVLLCPEVIDLINSRDTFDLILYEMFLEDIFLGFAHKFRAPSIAIATAYTFPWVVDRFAIPGNPSYVPIMSFPHKNHMPFLTRIKNVLLSIYKRAFYKFLIEPKSTEIVQRHFGKSTPSVYELARNTSLLFLNTHSSIFGSQPYPPQVVDISGIHLTQPQPLQQDLAKWMEDSGDAGVIYFSFGSMVRAATLPADKARAFLSVFATLPQRVLWKWEEDAIAQETTPPNVKIMKWLPQRDVLAHPRVRAFISHGGLLGTTEAVASGVPVLAIPMYGDQPNNVASLVECGVAVRVDYNNISVASVSYALHALLNDQSYSTNVKELSRRFLDRPMSPLDTAVWWTEYVIRHRGAPHLQSAAVHLTWYQYYLLDVAAACLTAVFLSLATVYYMIKSCLRFVVSKQSTKLKSS